MKVSGLSFLQMAQSSAWGEGEGEGEGEGYR